MDILFLLLKVKFFSFLRVVWLATFGLKVLALGRVSNEHWYEAPNSALVPRYLKSALSAKGLALRKSTSALNSFEAIILVPLVIFSA